MSAYIMDTIYLIVSFLAIGWNWTPVESLPIQVYHNKLWEANYYDHFYQICHFVMTPFHQALFYTKLPRMSRPTMDCLERILDWQTEGNFSFIRVLSCLSPPHVLPLYILDMLLCKEVAYQIMRIGITVELKKGNLREYGLSSRFQLVLIPFKTPDMPKKS